MYLIYMTLITPVLIGVAALGTEGGLRLYQHQNLQGAADAAAYSAAVAAYIRNETSAQYTTEAEAIVGQYTGSTVTTCNPSSPPSVCVTVPYSNAIEVDVSQPQTRFFSSYWFSNTQPDVTSAVATINKIGGDCVLTTNLTAQKAIQASGWASYYCERMRSL